MNDAEACCKAMSKHPHPEVKNQGSRLLALMKHAERQFAGEWGTGQDALDIFSDPMIAMATARSDFRLVDLQYGKRPMTLYLGAESVTDLLHLYPLFRSVLQATYYQLTSIQTYVRRRHELLMLLNEFPQLGYMDILEQAPAHARSFGIRFLIVIQDIAQLFSTYGRDTAIWGNIATKVFHGPVHDETALRMERMLGPETVEVTSTHTNRGRVGRSRSTHPTARSLMTQAEILGMGEDQEMIWVQGCPHPVLARKIRYWHDRY
jgi:type IV secretion system protein VirD4